MIDVIGIFLSQEAMRDLMVIMCVVSAVVIGPILSFAVTPDAGIHCKIAFVRLLQRFALGGFSISLMYWAMFVLVEQRPVPGPTLLVVFFMFTSTMISAWRHLSAPPVPQTNTWRTPLPHHWW